MPKLRSLSSHSCLLLSLAIAACGGDDSPSVVDASTAVDGHVADAPEAALDAPAADVRGAWTTYWDGIYFWHTFRYAFTGTATGGDVAIAHERVDVQGQFLDCTQQDIATGTWTIVNGNLDVIVTSGTTSRQTTAGMPSSYTCEQAYAQRAMTIDELRAVDLADGPMRFEDESLITSWHENEERWSPAN